MAPQLGDEIGGFESKKEKKLKKKKEKLLKREAAIEKQNLQQAEKEKK